MKQFIVLGSTGSIGRCCLKIIEKNPERFGVAALACGSNVRLMREQIEAFCPQNVYLACGEKPAANVRYAESLAELVAMTQADAVLVATTGSAAVLAVKTAIEKGMQVLLANKETLVCAGGVITALARRYHAKLIPVDSEHSAIWQCMQGRCNESPVRLILTASGGAFRDLTLSQLEHVTPEAALRHPNWDMGSKITIDCATMVNKALEVIEAKWLFDMPMERIDCIQHRESIVHSMAEFRDGSVIAEMSYPTMEIPITLAMTYPARIDTGVNRLNFAEVAKLTFEPIDEKKYPCFTLARQCGIEGGILPAVMSAANEVAVERFLDGRIKFTQISEVLKRVLDRFKNIGKPSLEEILDADTKARKIAYKLTK